MDCLVVKFLGKIISANIIRDIRESYLVAKNPMHLCVGGSGTGRDSRIELKLNSEF